MDREVPSAGCAGTAAGRPLSAESGGLILVNIVLFFGDSPPQLLNQMGQTSGTSLGGRGGGVGTAPAGQERQVAFVERVLGDTDDVWLRPFGERGKKHQVAVLVLISESVDSACGFATSATGRFYYPEDSEVHIDLWFSIISRTSTGPRATLPRRV